ncbi:MAG: EAL domain-containing protein [Actinomycetota bacterium]|nr:EAL domain-containing protein [Actinomycetota bacterium]
MREERRIARSGEIPELAVRNPEVVECGSDVQSLASGEVERRYRTLVEQLPLVVYVDALDELSSNIFTSRQIEPLLGWTVEEWQTSPDLFVRTLHPDDRERVIEAHARTHRTHEPLSIEYRLVSRSGDIVWVRDEGVVVCDDDGEALHLQGYLLDITVEREAQAQLRRQALYDPLTGLANRTFFHEQLEHAVSLRKEGDRQTALLYVDLNDFKEINDQNGHSVGDEVLAVLGARIKSVIRAGDAVARLGGDEFALLLTVVSEPSEVLAVADRLLKRVAEPVQVAGRTFRVSASVGIAIGSSGSDLVRQADAAMYRAKSQPGMDYAFYDDQLDRTSFDRFKRIGELRRALAEDELVLAYQPVVRLEPFEVVGLEALLRWQHPERGEVAPLDVIPLAEECGLIIPIGRRALEEACAYAAELRRIGGRDLEMSVNVSASQLQHAAFVDHVDSALESSGLPPRLLTLELTESVLIAAVDRVEQQLGALKERGVKLALDDFGTGYASLAYLQALPVDIVKIDRSFTANIDSGEDALALLRGIVGLGNALGLELVAEGIERPAQHGIVRRLGCHGAQGFRFGRPVSRELTTERVLPHASAPASRIP